ncbi:MAG TPA: hypothetical protein VLA91_13045 [Acidimicrobiia bacterium]|nr:hypothetical protein [Acidimicrobiia bacterium]
MRLRLAALVFLLGLSACGGEATTANVNGTGEPLALSDLTGKWANDSVTLRVNDAGDFVVLSAGDQDQTDPLLAGFVARDEAELIFVNGIGGQCPGQSGVYGAAIDEGTLTLSLVEDPCPARVAWFQTPLARVED